MTTITLELSAEVWGSLQAHLLPAGTSVEQAAFLYTQAERDVGGNVTFKFLEYAPVQPTGFAAQHSYYLELDDKQRASVIKRAHDLNASIVELHSHPGPHPARFSPSDMDGFGEFVPHVWWRLKNRPYLAVVVAQSGFDALAWIDSPSTSVKLDAIVLDNDRHLVPTGLTLQSKQKGGGYYGPV
jgi:proteasome lid subunit RPN8/RPN11